MSTQPRMPDESSAILARGPVAVEDFENRELDVRTSETTEAAARLIEDGNPSGALMFLNSALSEYENAELWNDWACAASACGDQGLAENGFRRALMCEASHRQAAVNLTALLLVQRRLEEAVPFLQTLQGRLTEAEKQILRDLTNHDHQG